MSLITRCPACGTMFKVVTDQLKVSQGWVRCGQCSDVFDASQHLLPVEPAAGDTVSQALEDTERTPLASTDEVRQAESNAESNAKSIADSKADSNASETRSHAESDLKSSAEPGPESESELPPADGDRTDAKVEAEWSFPRWVAGKLTAAPSQAATEAQDSAADFDPAGWKEALKKRQQREDGAASAFANLGYGGSIQPDSDFSGVAEEPPRRPDLVRKVTIADAEFEEEFDASMQLELQTEKEVSFVVDAERKAFWMRPRVRGVLGVLAVVLSLVLVLQIGLQQRDSLAASTPALRPVLAAMCNQLGCKIQTPRRVESLLIDSSTFNKLATDAYRLSFVLKNNSNLPVEMPAIEVTLTDTQDQPLIRRIVLPAQFGAQSPVLAARAEMTGAVSMKVVADTARPGSSSTSSSSSSSTAPATSLRVTGYRVLAFYP